MDTTKIEPRRSGKTFRAVLKALHEASSGKEVVFVAKTQTLAEYMCHMAYMFLHSYGIDKDETYQRTRQTIKFGRGKITFVNLDYYNSPRIKSHQIIIKDILEDM